jgi:O-antigen/teichoic acid export membrane protein
VSASQAEEIGGVRPILRRVFANAGMLLGGRTVGALMGLATMAVAARALKAETFGVLVLIQAFAMFLGEVVRFQSWQTVLHFGARPLAEGRTTDFQRVVRFTLILDLASTAIGLAVGVAGALAFAGLLGWSEREAPAAAVYMLTIAFMVSATPVGLLRLFDRFDVLARQAALISFLRLAFSLVAFALGGGLVAFLLAWGAGTVGSWLYLAGSALAELRRRGLTRGFAWRGPLTEGMPKAWKFAWNTNLAGTLDVAFTHVSTLVIGALIGPAPAAFWRVGRQVADAMAKPARLVALALYPELARLNAGDRRETMWGLTKGVAVAGGAVGVLLLGVSAMAGEPLLRTVLGAEFGAAAGVMTWQVAAAVVGIFAMPLEPLLISLGKPGRVVRVRLVVSLAYLAALPFLLDAFGLIGAGFGLAAAAVGLALGMLWFILRESGNRRGGAPPAHQPPETPPPETVEG